MDNTRKNKANFVLYIVLALIIVAVVCMTVMSIVTGSKRKNPTNPLPKVTDTAKRTEKKETTGRPEDTYIPDESTLDVDSNNPSSEPDKDVSAPLKLNVMAPVENGYLLKGYDIDMPVFSVTMNDYRVHAGIDILADAGSPVMAIAEGTVENIYNDPMMGNCISISHPNGLTSYYMGLSDEVCEGIVEGAPVLCGQNISSVGDSTLIEIAEESHLHFELKDDGKYVDPTGYFNIESVSASNRVDENYEG